MPLAGTAGVDFVVLVATSLTFETAGFSILSVNPALALLLLMKVPDVSLELGTETGVRDALFGSVVTLLAIGVALLTAARVAAGVVFFAGVPLVAGFAAGFAAGFILLFTGFFAGLAIDFVADVTVFEAGFSVFAIVFANLPATVFNSDFLAGAVVALLFDAVVFVIPLMLLAAALLVADLVTVAFMVSSDNDPPDLFDLYPKTVQSAVFRKARIASGDACDIYRRILPNDYLRCLNLNQTIVYTKHCSRPRIKVSFGRFLPMNTILLPRGSFSGHFAPISVPII